LSLIFYFLVFIFSIKKSFLVKFFFIIIHDTSEAITPTENEGLDLTIFSFKSFINHP